VVTRSRTQLARARVVGPAIVVVVAVRQASWRAGVVCLSINEMKVSFDLQSTCKASGSNSQTVLKSSSLTVQPAQKCRL
jgi:hypothetical protein